MAPVTEHDAEAAGEVEFAPVASVVVALFVGLLLVLCARAGAVQLLIAIALLQALLAPAWVFGIALPGRKGALVIAALAAAAADVTVSVWPHGRLGTLLAVCGLAVPAMFVHQLTRGAVRERAVASLGGIALLVLAEVALPSLLQLRHEFVGTLVGGDVVAGVCAAVAGALVIGYLVDMVVSTPRFDPRVPRGLLGMLASAALGGALGYLLLQTADSPDFSSGRGAFVGASLGALVALLAVGIAFVEYEVALPDSPLGRRVRPALSVVLPISVLAPVAFLLCLAIRA